MKGYKDNRRKSNPYEEDFARKFIEQFCEPDKHHENQSIQSIIFDRDNAASPERIMHTEENTLTEREKKICVTLVQWFGTNVGRSFFG